MPELKHGFGAAKMNKDADERIVPNGEYRDALNIEIVTSEGSDVGSMQTLMGNTKIASSTITPGLINNTAKCVGSIADEKNNNLYYFIADPDNFTDYIFQYNSDTKVLIPVVVDKYEINVTASDEVITSPANIKTHFIVNDITNIRPGMTIQGSFIVTLPGGSTAPLSVIHEDGLIITRLEFISAGEWNVYMDETSTSLNIFSTGVTSFIAQTWNLKAGRTLNFKGNQITGINIIDGVLFWTDGETEPKKIIVDNFIKEPIGNSLRGTNANGEVHSNFNVYDKYEVLLQYNSPNVIDFRDQPEGLKEEHITVIKKSPLYPPTVLLSNTSDFRFNAGTASNFFSQINDYFVDEADDIIEVGSIKNTEFSGGNANPDYKVGDLMLLRRDGSFETVPDLDNYDIIAEILEYTSGISNVKLKIVFIKNELPGTFGTNEIFYTTLQQEKPLYEFKLPRFAYRYKYQDNQYSPYSPFSEPAFLPSEFIYNPKEGHNLGMINTLRSLYIMDFLPDQDALPKDILEVDIVYKESNTSNVYIVQTIKYGDDEWIADGSVINTLAANYARTKGALLITSEMVKAAVASNQLLRPWDNVPRAAKAQEIVGNRIVYANYLQNYNL